MAVKESFVNGKIPASHIPYTLVLLEHYIATLRSSLKRKEMASDQLEYIHTWFHPDAAEEERRGLYAIHRNLNNLSQMLFDDVANDLFEFFYGRDDPPPEMGEYFYHYYPLDMKKYESGRIPIGKMRLATYGKERLNKVIMGYVEHNHKEFIECLRLKEEDEK